MDEDLWKDMDRVKDPSSTDLRRQVPGAVEFRGAGAPPWLSAYWR